MSLTIKTTNKTHRNDLEISYLGIITQLHRMSNWKDIPRSSETNLNIGKIPIPCYLVGQDYLDINQDPMVLIIRNLFSNHFKTRKPKKKENVLHILIILLYSLHMCKQKLIQTILLLCDNYISKKLHIIKNCHTKKSFL